MLPVLRFPYATSAAATLSSSGCASSTANFHVDAVPRLPAYGSPSPNETTNMLRVRTSCVVSMREQLRIGPCTFHVVHTCAGMNAGACALRLTNDNHDRIIIALQSPVLLNYHFTIQYQTDDTLLTLIDFISALAAIHRQPYTQRRHQLDALVATDRFSRFTAAPAFNPSWLQLHERSVLVVDRGCGRVVPLHEYPGRVVVTERRVLFQPYFNVETEPVEVYHLANVRSVHARRYNLRAVAAELVMHDAAAPATGAAKSARRSQSSPLFYFRNKHDRDTFIEAVLAQTATHVDQESPMEEITERWVRGVMSNFDYLMAVNHWAGRTTNDLAQYPVFPVSENVKARLSESACML